MPPQPNDSFTPAQTATACPWYQPLCKVTPVSKYLAMAVFIILPFIGAYVGYQLAGEDVNKSVRIIDDSSVNAANDVDQPAVASQNIDTNFVKLEDGQSYVSGDHNLLGYKRQGVKVYLIRTNGAEEIVSEVIGTNADNFYVSKSKSIFAHDDSRVFVEGEPILGADIATFIPLVGYPSGLETEIAVSKDKNAVYIYTKKLSQADAASFIALGTFGARFFAGMGIDKNNIYVFGKENQNVYPLLLDTGEKIMISNTANIALGFDQVPGSEAIVYPEPFMTWYDFRFGLSIEGVGYINRGYIIDGSNVYSMYDICHGMMSEGNRVCDFTITKVSRVGEIPPKVLEKAKTFGVKESY